MRPSTQLAYACLRTSYGHQAEWIGLTDDGLEIGHLGYPAGAQWLGYWVDHPQQYRLFVSDGAAQVTVGDYMQSCQHWLTLENWNTYRQSSFPLKVDADRAAALAAAVPLQRVRVMARLAQPRIAIPRLGEPLPIDGDLAKWRKAGISPQILLTPATATAGIRNPADLSGVIRLAYEGKSLYVQSLRFGNVVSFHQTVATGTHIQDTLEMMLNGFMKGFQFSVSRFSTDGDQIVRRRFAFQRGLPPYLVPADHAPRFVKVLDNAKDVEERKLIEAGCGMDLSGCKVIVTEFKLPIDEVTYKDSPETLFEVGPGKTVWIGFTLDHNNVPGTDAQDTIVWPANFSTFADKEFSALATFE